MRDFFNHSFQKALWSSRFLVLIAVVVSVLSALALFVLVAVDFIGVLTTMAGAFNPYAAPTSRETLLGETARQIITVIDASLLGAFMLIFGFGLYELFLGELLPARYSNASARLLHIESLDDLKTRLAKLILIILIVEIFKDASELKLHSPIDLLYLALSIALIALAIYLTHGHATAGGIPVDRAPGRAAGEQEKAAPP
ncbi:MAG TPA: YqhA family protein [Chthoniobacterales bacterium]